MDTLANMRTAVQNDLTVGDESTLYSPTTIDLAINRAYRKAAALFPWGELQDAKTTTAENSNTYYDYPQNWRTRSIWKVVVDGVRYGEEPDGSPLSFDDYLNWKEDYPDDTSKKWANQERRYFLTPTPTNGVTICIWGIKNVTALSDAEPTTVFSYSTPEVNEAIVLEAGAILKSKGEQNDSAEFKSLEAKQILSVSWAKIRAENAKYEKNQPFFYVPNFFGKTSTKDLRGRFD